MISFDRITSKRFTYKHKKETYWVSGNTSNPPLVMVPGFTGTYRDQHELINVLDKQFFVIMPDLPGWGVSPRLKERLTIDAYTQFIKIMIESAGYKKVFLYGHCMGTMVAISFAKQFFQMVKKLVLVSPPYIDGTIAKPFFLYLAGASERSPRLIRPMFFLWRSRPVLIIMRFFMLKFRSFRKKLRRIIYTFEEQSKHDEDVVEENWVSSIRFNFEKVKNINISTIIIHGKKDLLIPPQQAEKLHGMFPNAKLEIIKTAGHLPPLETPKTLARCISEFLQ